MNLKLPNIICFLRHFTFVIIMNVIVVLPVEKVFENFNHAQYELTDLNFEEDNKEEEKQKDDIKNEKIEFHAIHYNYQYYLNNKEASSYSHPKLLWNFNQEIPIPPPEKI